MPKKTIAEKNFWQRLPMRWRVIFILVALILASHGFRCIVPVQPEPSPIQRVALVKSFDVDTVFEESLSHNVSSKNIKRSKARVSGVYVSNLVEEPDPVKIAYAEFTSDKPSETSSAEVPTDPIPPVLLIHGLGRDGSSLYPLARELVAHGVQRVIVPDLPGAGASCRDVEDYSVEATAGTLFSLLDVLKVRNANVLGFGSGGGVAIFMSHQQPERVHSLALVSSLGAQEFELLGNHIVNKIVYTFCLGFFKIVEDVVPHFGLLDSRNVNKACTRVLWDSDISDIKKYIREWNKPIFLAHGENDWLSSIESAEYTKELAPQAETLFIPGGHSVFLKDPEKLKLSFDYALFLTRISVPSKYQEMSRTADEVELVYPPVVPANGARVVVLMVIIFACTFVAEDPTCLATGLLVAQGLVDFFPATLACLLGIFIGDLSLYMIGRCLGRPILRKPPLKWFVSEQQIDEMSERFSKNPRGLAIIVSSRFIPGSRVPTFIAAGIMKLNWHKLFILFFVAAALWTPPLILIAEKVGAGVIEQFKEWHHAAAWIVIGAIVALYLATHYIFPAFTWRGRRRHVMTRRQITRHEFWPHFILCIPVAAQYLWLSLRYRSFTLFTLASTGLGKLGGFPGGSKLEPYRNFLRNSDVGVRTVFVPAEKDLGIRWENTLKILKQEKISFPCVLKPEIGDGGIGVCIVRSAEHLKSWLEANHDDAIAQEYVEGNEYEVVWSRLPGAKEGRIQSVIQKDFVSVKGDGERKLEELIWADDVAVSNGKLFSKLNFHYNLKVLGAGEIFRLAPIGTRIKGARYISRPELRAGTLSKAIDELADACGNVHYVCLDVRVAGDEELSNGRGMRITSVKGTGATSSAIFDGYVRMGRAYARIYKQLQFCFAVGAKLRKRGIRPEVSTFRLFETWGTARGRS
ncbi:MAG: alpha/beta fold hydrolase, partial [Coprobacillus sp.]|nr:alpha/beta fold hydrolase [Coprobacillus sp.]